MSGKKVAIGIPVFNGERWLRDTLSSVSRQTYRELHIIVSDNASTDGTERICKEFQRDDSRIHYFRNAENIGIFRNYDRVFELSDAEMFKWWAIGDRCDPMFVEKCVNALDENPDAVLAHSQTVLFTENPDGQKIYDSCIALDSDDPVKRFIDYLAGTRLNNAMNGVIRAAALRKTALNEVYLSSDLTMFAELALLGKFIELPEPMFFRRMQQETATAKKDYQEKSRFYASEPEKVMRRPRLKYEYGLMRAAARAGIGVPERLRLFWFLAKRIGRSRAQIFRELFAFAPKEQRASQ